MRHMLRIAICASLVLAAACSPPTDDSISAPATLLQAERDQTEEMILGASKEWSDGLATGELAVLDRILAPDFIYTVDSGEVHDRASFRALPSTFVSYELGDVSLRWYSDNVIVVTGVGNFTMIDADGVEIDGAGAFTNVWVEREGRWQCVVGHSTDVVSSPLF